MAGEDQVVEQVVVEVPEVDLTGGAGGSVYVVQRAGSGSDCASWTDVARVTAPGAGEARDDLEGGGVGRGVAGGQVAVERDAAGARCGGGAGAPGGVEAARSGVGDRLMVGLNERAVEAANAAMRDEVDRYERLGRPPHGAKVVRAYFAALDPGAEARVTAALAVVDWDAIRRGEADPEEAAAHAVRAAIGLLPAAAGSS